MNTNDKNANAEKAYLANTFNSWLKEDYYKILGIKHNASNDDINKAFKKVIKTANPHIYPKESIMFKYAELKLKHLIEIRETLLDQNKRNQYDFERQLSQDCYINFMASSSILIDNKKENKVQTKKSSVLNDYVNQDMRIYNISQSEMSTLDELYNFCQATNLYN